jgi:hypothetical protein
MSDPSTRYSGTLELSWTNKHLRLLAEEDGAYQWVPPSDYRVAEVRLLDEADEAEPATHPRMIAVGRSARETYLPASGQSESWRTVCRI